MVSVMPVNTIFSFFLNLLKIQISTQKTNPITLGHFESLGSSLCASCPKFFTLTPTLKP